MRLSWVDRGLTVGISNGRLGLIRLRVVSLYLGHRPLGIRS